MPPFSNAKRSCFITPVEDLADNDGLDAGRHHHLLGLHAVISKPSKGHVYLLLQSLCILLHLEAWHTTDISGACQGELVYCQCSVLFTGHSGSA